MQTIVSGDHTLFSRGLARARVSLLRRRAVTRGTLAVLLAAVLCLGSTAAAQPSDTPGSRDHPLISRYAGSYIIGFDTRDFDDLTIPLGPTIPAASPTGGAFQYAKSQRVEGTLTRILYVAPEGRASLEVLRNYRVYHD
jgi:OmpA-OmpF porin, OOP family